MGRHKHSWNEIERTYYGPRHLTKATNITTEQLNFLLYGRTVITYRCECGMREQDSLLGDVKT